MLLGLPLHPLAVHFGIVLGLLAAGAVLLSAVLPLFRTWLGWGLPVSGVVGGITLRVTQSFGAMLHNSSTRFHTALVEEHMVWGARAGYSGIALGLVSILLWLTTSPWARARWTDRWPRWVAVVAQVLAVVTALVTVVVVTLAGHSGSRAVWT